MKPRCWKCQSFNVHVRFTGYTPTFHAAGECDCPADGRESCGETPSGECTCFNCGLVWEEGNISEFELAS